MTGKASKMLSRSARSRASGSGGSGVGAPRDSANSHVHAHSQGQIIGQLDVGAVHSHASLGAKGRNGDVGSLRGSGGSAFGMPDSMGGCVPGVKPIGDISRGSSLPIGLKGSHQMQTSTSIPFRIGGTAPINDPGHPTQSTVLSVTGALSDGNQQRRTDGHVLDASRGQNDIGKGRQRVLPSGSRLPSGPTSSSMLNSSKPAPDTQRLPVSVGARNDGWTTAFLLSKCVDILKDISLSAIRARERELERVVDQTQEPIVGLTTMALQAKLKEVLGDCGVAIASDTTFLQCLSAQPHIVRELCPQRQTRLWRYVSPYEHLTSIVKLKAMITSSKTGVEVSREMLESCPRAQGWIETLLRRYDVRVVRTGKKPKCEWYPPDSEEQCSMYAAKSERCEACGDLKGLTLYRRTPLLSLIHNRNNSKSLPPTSGITSATPAAPQKDISSDSEARQQSEGSDLAGGVAVDGPGCEELGPPEPLPRVDKDINALWHSATLPCLEDLLSCYNMSVARHMDTGMRRGAKRKRPAGGLKAGRVNKVQNAHLFSTEELNAAVQRNQQREEETDRQGR